MSLRQRCSVPSAVYSQLQYEVEYQKLSATGTTYTRPRTSVTSLSNRGSHYRLEARLTGLNAATVYRARIRFFRRDVTGLTFPLGATSTWYYTTTAGSYGTSPARTKIVLRGLYEHFLSYQLGYTGYMGKTHLNGSRYGGPVNEGWCSEFYSWVAGTALTIPFCVSIRPVADYFTSKTAYTRVTNPRAVRFSLTRGDYLSLDTTGDGDRNHSVMVLDYDVTRDEVWTLEGNTSGRTDIGDGFDSRAAGDETMVRTRGMGTLHGWGRIRTSMLDVPIRP